MSSKQEIQQCISECTNSANMIRLAANSVPNASVREMLTLGASHIEMCIRQCETAAKQVQ